MSRPPIGYPSAAPSAAGMAWPSALATAPYRGFAAAKDCLTGGRS